MKYPSRMANLIVLALAVFFVAPVPGQTTPVPEPTRSTDLVSQSETIRGGTCDSAGHDAAGAAAQVGAPDEPVAIDETHCEADLTYDSLRQIGDPPRGLLRPCGPQSTLVSECARTSPRVCPIM